MKRKAKDKLTVIFDEIKILTKSILAYCEISSNIEVVFHDCLFFNNLTHKKCHCLHIRECYQTGYFISCARMPKRGLGRGGVSRCRMDAKKETMGKEAV